MGTYPVSCVRFWRRIRENNADVPANTFWTRAQLAIIAHYIQMTKRRTQRMIKQYNGFKAERSGGAREILPAGGHVGKILDARVQDYSWGSVLVLSHDVSEGEYKDFFRRDYAENTNEDKKWRGNLRLNIPKDDGSEKDEWTKRTFNNAMWAIEESNPGYTWNWDEKSLKNKTVGLLYRNKEWGMNGNTGWTTECCALASADDIREGKFKVPKDKPLKEKPAAAVNWTEIADDDDSDLPF